MPTIEVLYRPPIKCASCFLFIIVCVMNVHLMHYSLSQSQLLQPLQPREGGAGRLSRQRTLMNQMMVRYFRSEQSLFDNPRCSRSGSVLKLASTYYTTYQMYCLSLRHSECIMFTSCIIHYLRASYCSPCSQERAGQEGSQEDRGH